MKAELAGMIELYRQARRDKAEARRKVRELVEETGQHQMREQKADAVLKHLEPLLHALEGGPEAMNEASQELQAESLDQARAAAKPTGHKDSSPARPSEAAKPPMRVGPKIPEALPAAAPK